MEIYGLILVTIFVLSICAFMLVAAWDILFR